MAAASTSRWSVNVFDPALPGRSSIARHSRVFRHHAPSGWKPYPFFQVGAAPSLSECAVTRVASMSMTTHSVSVFPATASHGNPAGVPSIRFHACARALARARAIRSSTAGAPARSRARRTVGPLGAAPSTGPRCASTAISLMLVAPSAIAAAIDTSTIPRSKTGDFPAFRSAPLSKTANPTWSAAFRSRTAPAWPTRPVPSAVTFRAWSHPLCCMAKSAPVWETCVQ
jgi:hypothetical protein